MQKNSKSYEQNFHNISSLCCVLPKVCTISFLSEARFKSGEARGQRAVDCGRGRGQRGALPGGVARLGRPAQRARHHAVVGRRLVQPRRRVARRAQGPPAAGKIFDGCGKNISSLLPAGPVEVAGVRGGGVRPRGASQPGRGGVNRRVVAQSVVGLARGGGCPRAAAGIHEGAALGVDLLPLLDGVEEDAAHAAAGGDLPQLLLLLLQLVVDLVPVGLRLLRLVLLHGLGPAPPPRLVRVEEGRRGEVVPLYRRGLLLLHLLPVRIVRHLDGLLVVHVWGPRSGRLG